MLDGITYTNTAKVNFNLLTYMIGNYHYNWHEEIELIWLLKGTVEANVDGNQYMMHQNDLLVINSNCGHATFALEKDCIAMRLHIPPAFLIGQGINLDQGGFNLNSVRLRRHRDYDLIRQLLAQLSLGIQRHQSAFTINTLYFRLTNVLVTDFLTQHSQPAKRPKRRQGSLRRVIAYINQNYGQDINLETVARVGHYSTAYLSRIFKAELGINYYEYCTRCRLQHALIELEDPSIKIAEVAFDNGFKEVKSFNMMFKKHFGQTPSAYRSHLSSIEHPKTDLFKRPLSHEQEQWLEDSLTEWLKVRKDEQLSACDHCTYRQYFMEYQELRTKVNQLKSLLNQ